MTFAQITHKKRIFFFFFHSFEQYFNVSLSIEQFSMWLIYANSTINFTRLWISNFPSFWIAWGDLLKFQPKSHRLPWIYNIIWLNCTEEKKRKSKNSFKWLKQIISTEWQLNLSKTYSWYLLWIFSFVMHIYYKRFIHKFISKTFIFRFLFIWRIDVNVYSHLQLISICNWLNLMQSVSSLIILARW